jgi:hypothetical protein
MTGYVGRIESETLKNKTKSQAEAAEAAAHHR